MILRKRDEGLDKCDCEQVVERVSESKAVKVVRDTMLRESAERIASRLAKDRHKVAIWEGWLLFHHKEGGK